MALEDDYRRLAVGFIDGASIAGMDPQRLGMGPITSPVAESPQGDFAAALAQFIAQEQAGPTAANGYYIPEFEEGTDWAPGADGTIRAPEPSRESAAKFPNQQARADRMQANWGSQGFTFSVDPNTGTTTISNTEKTRAAAGLTQATATELNAPRNFRAQMQAIQAEKDPVARAEMFANLQAQAGVHKAEIYKQVLSQAEAKLNIPQLEAALRDNEAADRADPDWKQFQSDSTATSNIRQQILRARGQADNEAKQMLMGNSALASLEAQLTTAEALFKRTEQQQMQMDAMKERASARKEQLDDARTDRAAARKEEIIFRQELEDKEMLQQTSPEALERISLIDPSFAGKSDVEKARYINKGVQDKALKEALLTPEESLLEASIAGNASAARILATKEAQRSGKSVAEVEAELGSLRAGLGNDKLVKDGLKALYKDTPEAAEQAKMILQKAMLGGTKTDIEQAQALKWQVMQAVARQKVEHNFLGNAEGWAVGDPLFQEAVAKAKSTSGSAAAAEVLAAYVGDATGPERQLKIAQFFQHFDAAATPKAKSLIAPLNTEFMRQRLIADMNKKSLWEKLQGGGQSIMQSSLGQGLGFGTLDTVNSFFGGK